MEKQEFLEKHLTKRNGTDCLKWDGLEDKYGDSDLLAMWIADMEFKTCSAIIDAMKKRLEHGVFGYSKVPEGYEQAFSKWMKKRYQFPIREEWIRFSTGCVTGLAWMLQAFTQPEDACLILTPVYYPFHNVITYNNRKLVTVDLDYDDGYFKMNYTAIEKAIIEDEVKLFLICSPHNPAGRVWKETELQKILEICRRHNVLVVSDEIHQDMILEGHTFIPAAIVDDGKYRDIIVTLSSASKTFNLAGLPHSHIIITDEQMMARYDNFAKGMNRTEINILAATATQAGYTYGEEWLENLMEVIQDNYAYLKTELEEKVPDIKVCTLEGTYLVMLDMRKCRIKSSMQEFIQNRCRLAVDYGEEFGEGFEGFIRLNLATDPAYVKQAVQNIIGELKN